MAITSRSSAATQNLGQLVGSTPDATSTAYQATRNATPFYISQWIGANSTAEPGLGVAAGDTNNALLDVTGNTFIVFQVSTAGTFSGSFQGTIDNVNWTPLIPEVGSTATTAVITAAGIYKYRGMFLAMRFVTTAVSGQLTISASAVAGS